MKIYVIIKTLQDSYPELIEAHKDKELAESRKEIMQDDYNDSMEWDHKYEWSRYELEVQEVTIMLESETT